MQTIINLGKDDFVARTENMRKREREGKWKKLIRIKGYGILLFRIKKSPGYLGSTIRVHLINPWVVSKIF